MNCKKCGTQALPDDNFCQNCGNPLRTQDEKKASSIETAEEQEVIEVSIPPSKSSKPAEQPGKEFEESKYQGILMADWFYAIGNEKKGPIPGKAIISLFKNSDINKDTLVWSEGMDGWLPYSKSEVNNHGQRPWH